MRKALAGAVVLLSLIMSSFMLFAAPASAAEQTVTVRDNLFDPATKSVNVGDTIRWTNQGTNTHNVTFDPPLGANLGDMGPASSSPNNQSVSPAFTTPGTFTYYCRFHQSLGMRGTVIVGSAGVGTGAQRITSNATSIPAGGSITVQGTGWPASTQVDLFLTPGNYPLSTATSDVSGNFSQLVAIPANGAPGTYQLNATVKGNPSVAAPTLPFTITAATTGTTVTTSATASTVTTLASGSLPSTLPPGAGVGSSGTSFGGSSAAGTARTGRNEHVMMITAAIALAMGTLLVMITPKPGRHARKALVKFF